MLHHKIICGKAELELKEFENNTFDSCVTDSPYGLEFMGRDWDTFRPKNEIKDCSGIMKDKNFKALPSFSPSQNVRCPVCGKWKWDYPDRKCTCGGADKYAKESFNFAFQQFTYQWASELYRVMKPGAHILVFGGTRTYHRMACAIEDAGFEVRDMINWVYGSGFPKSHNIGKAVDKLQGNEREAGNFRTDGRGKWNLKMQKNPGDGDTGVGHADGSKQRYFESKGTSEWEGWGTGLKPAHEPIVLARKPLPEKTIAKNVLKWGTGGLNIDGCRITKQQGDRTKYGVNGIQRKTGNVWGKQYGKIKFDGTQARFPANLILECCCEEDELVEGEAKSGGGETIRKKTLFSDSHDSSQYFNYADKKGNEKCLIHTNPNCVCRMLDMQSGETSITGNRKDPLKGYSCREGKEWFGRKNHNGDEYHDKGGASRFFYQAKASQSERWFHCTICKEAYPMKERDKHIHDVSQKEKYKYLEFHPTQKPEKLIEYLVRLVTPPNGTMLDPFMGTGTGLIAAEREGFNSVGIDSKYEYCKIAEKRLKSGMEQLRMDRKPSIIEKVGF